MQKFKTLSMSRLAKLIGGMVLTLGMTWFLMGTAQAKDSDQDAQQNDHQSSGEQTLASEVAELHARVAKLEAALKQGRKGTPSSAPDTGGQADKAQGVPPGERISAKFQNCLQCHQKRPSGPLPASHLEEAGDSDKGTEEVGAADGQGSPAPDAGMKMKGQGGKDMGGGMGMEKMGRGMGMGMRKMRKGMGMEKMGRGGQGGGAGKGKGMTGHGGQGMDGEGGVADETKGMDAKGGGKDEMGSSNSGTMDQQMKQMQQQMQQIVQMQLLQMKMMEMQMKMMEMK